MGLVEAPASSLRGRASKSAFPGSGLGTGFYRYCYDFNLKSKI
jgi:hypothetical protein